MLTHPVIEKLKTLRLLTMATTLKEQKNQNDLDALSFEERLSLLVDIEITARDNRRLQTRLRKAKLKQSPYFEDVDYTSARGLDKSLIDTTKSLGN